MQYYVTIPSLSNLEKKINSSAESTGEQESTFSNTEVSSIRVQQITITHKLIIQEIRQINIVEESREPIPMIWKM